MKIEQVLREKRDHKTISHLEQYAPVWIVNEKIIVKDEAIQFDVVFQHPQYGWVNRRYRYDGFNDVLYYKGQIAVSEKDVLAIQEKEPYLAPDIADIPNSYGG
jgi:hypothetical protein